MNVLLTNLVVLLLVILVAGLIFSYKFIKKNSKRIFESRLFSKLFPEMSKRKMVESAKLASIIAIIISMITLASRAYRHNLSVSTMILPGLFFVLAWFTWKMSRLAATTLLAFYILEIIGRWVFYSDEASHYILIHLIFLFIFIKGMQGTVAYQRSLRSAKLVPTIQDPSLGNHKV